MSNSKIKNNNKNSYRKQTQLKEEQQVDDTWIYIMLLSSIVVLLESLKSFTFSIFNYSLTYSIFFVPFIFTLSNYIYKNYGNKKTIISIIISDIVMFIFVFLIHFSLGKIFILESIIGEFVAYIISQLINLFLNNYIIKNRKNILLLMGTYIFSIIIFYMVYTIIYLKDMNFDMYWISYFITVGIQIIICFPLSLFDRKIKNKKYVK